MAAIHAGEPPRPCQSRAMSRVRCGNPSKRACRRHPIDYRRGLRRTPGPRPRNARTPGGPRGVPQDRTEAGQAPLVRIGPPRSEAPGTLVFGLPGNPVSGIVGFLLFVKPALEVLAGKSPRGPSLLRATLLVPSNTAGTVPRITPPVARFRRDRPSAAAELAIEPLDWAGSADLGRSPRPMASRFSPRATVIIPRATGRFSPSGMSKPHG